MELFTNEVIRGLWLKQPFASLMLHGKIETRTYPTKVRGNVLICATKEPYDFEKVISISGYQTHDKIKEVFGHTKHTMLSQLFLPNGCPIAIGNLIDCRPMTKQDEDKCFVRFREPWVELTQTKTLHKRLYCWIFADVQKVEPFEIKGKQGWAILDEETKAKIKIIN